MVTIAELSRRVEAGFPRAVEVLEDLVRLPSISAYPQEGDPLGRSAEYVAGRLHAVGVSDVAIVHGTLPDGTKGGPGVIGRIPGPAGSPTVLLYAHHDVQPVTSDWDTDPWQPVVKDGRLYGRGAADDGAGVVVHLAALAALGSDLKVGLAVFIEGEEESGSPTFARLLAEHQDRLRADAVVVADSDNWSADVPALSVSLRGVTSLTVTLRIAEHAVHSGMYGGPILDAPLLLARLIATLHNEAGDVAVAGLEPVGSTDFDYPAERVRDEVGLLPGVAFAGTGTLAQQLWHYPAIGLIGFDATSVDLASNTIAPVARAELSLRIPPGADAVAAQAALIRHLEEHAPFGAHLEIVPGATGEGFVADVNGPAASAYQVALEQAFGQPVALLGQGGSIPLANEIVDVFPDIEVLLVGVEDQYSRAHSGNESVPLEMLRKAILAEAIFLARLGGTLDE
ncbi:MAG: M20/M25/M40 family metallo-hydrolase [Bifidobacteriaceae bacterium]|jgi:acetylornithine deacetylase/succinyl-diaminopimelate desuccinylase-like protein|nr:M20/M25/M40 family metallo-hydrolase [Bifidobacteriaceae bacterium]